MEELDKRKRAQKRVEQIKGFRIHLMIYLVINLMIVLGNVVWGNFSNEEYGWWGLLSTPFFWGIGLAIHAANVFGFNLIFGPRWEEREIRKYMDQDQKEADKFK